MKKKQILFYGLPYFSHNYGAQGLFLPLMHKIRESIDAECVFVLPARYYQENLDFAQKNAFTIIPEPNILAAIGQYSGLFRFLHQIRKIILTVKGKSQVIVAEKKRLDLLLKTLRQSDLVIDADGIEFVGTRAPMKKIQNFLATDYLKKLAQIYRKPYLKSPKSYGPFIGPVDFMLARNHFAGLPFILTRAGGVNLKELKKLKLNVPIYEFPDVSFVLKPASPIWAKNYLQKLKINLKKPIFGLSPSAVIFKEPKGQTSGENHFKLCQKIIAHFQSMGVQVLLLPHFVSTIDDPLICDHALCRKIYTSLKNQKNVFLIEDSSLTYAQARAIIGLLDFYVTGRFHALASSLAMAVPTVPLSWHMKYRDMISIFVQDIPMIDTRRDSIAKALGVIKRAYNHREWFNQDQVRSTKKRVDREVGQSIKMMIGEMK